MDVLQDYALIISVAVGILALTQLVFLVVLLVMVSKINQLVGTVKHTVDLSKDFVRDLRQEQGREAPLWRLGLYALARAKAMKAK